MGAPAREDMRGGSGAEVCVGALCRALSSVLLISLMNREFALSLTECMKNEITLAKIGFLPTVNRVIWFIIVT